MVRGIICQCYYIFGYAYESGIYDPVWNDKIQFLDYLVIQLNWQKFGFQQVDCLAPLPQGSGVTFALESLFVLDLKVVV